MRIERDLLALRGDLTRGKVEALEIRDPPGGPYGMGRLRWVAVSFKGTIMPLLSS